MYISLLKIEPLWVAWLSYYSRDSYDP